MIRRTRRADDRPNAWAPGTAEGGRFRRRLVRVAAAVLLLLVAALFVAPGLGDPAAAQSSSRELLRNLDGAGGFQLVVGGDTNRWMATRVRTGGNGPYSIESITVDFGATFDSDAQPHIEIWSSIEDSSGARPGSKLYDVNFESSLGRDLRTFEPPGGSARLDSGVSYWIVFRSYSDGEYHVRANPMRGAHAGAGTELGWNFHGRVRLNNVATDTPTFSSTSVVSTATYHHPRMIIRGRPLADPALADNTHVAAPNQIIVGGSGRLSVAQRVRAGNHPGGYSITSVTVDVRSVGGSDMQPTLAIHASDEGSGQGRPGRLLYTLTRPQNFGTGLQTFWVRGPGVRLEPNTSYWVVVSGAGQDFYLLWRGNNTRVQHNANLWSLHGSTHRTGDNAWSYIQFKETVDGNEVDRQYQHLKIAVRGSEVPVPELTSATVNAAGDQIDLRFSAPFAVPPNSLPFWLALQKSFSLTSRNTNISLTVNTSASDASIGKLVFDVSPSIKKGVAEVLTYTPPAAGEVGAIENAGGVRSGAFTTGQAGVPLVTNNSTLEDPVVATGFGLSNDAPRQAGGAGGWTFAQRFVTGSHANGYKLTSIALSVNMVYSSTDSRIEIFTSNEDNLGAGVGDLIATLRPPLDFSQGKEIFWADGDGVRLDPNTGYWLGVADNSTGFQFNVTHGRAALESAQGWTLHGWMFKSRNQAFPRIGFFESDSSARTFQQTIVDIRATEISVPTLNSATVNADGNAVELIIDRPFSVPTDPTELAAFWTALAGRFSGMADTTALTFTVNTAATGASDGKLVLTPSPTIEKDRTVVITYTDPTTGDDDNVIEDAGGADMPTFTTGEAGVPAVMNNSTTDVTPPTLVSVTVHESGGGASMSVVFSEDLTRLSLDSNTFNPNDFFVLTADGKKRSLDLDVHNTSSLDHLGFNIFPKIRAGQTVVLRYTDPTVGNDILAVQDLAGNDAASFVSGEGGVPDVTNDSLFVDTSPPAVSQAFVTSDGATLGIKFDDFLVVPDDAEQRTIFFSTLAGAFAVTANSAPVAFTIDTDSNTNDGGLILDLGRTVEMGAVVTLTYTKPSFGTVKIKDESDNETATFTHSTTDTNPKVFNDSTQDTAPWLASATVNAAGNEIDLIFDQNFVAPSDAMDLTAFYTALASRFGLTVNGSAVNVTVNTTESSPTASKLVLTPMSTINLGQNVVVTYTDLTTGDDENVIEDATGANGKETATFTTGMGGVPAVKNNSTQGTDTTPPTLVSATVNAAGTEITLTFSEDLSSSGPDIDWKPVVENATTVTADGFVRSVENVTRQLAPIKHQVVVKFWPKIRQGQTVVVSYADTTTGDDQLAIEDVAGNDAATFTTGSSGVPAVTNGSLFVDTEPPVINYAFVDTDGVKLEITFDDVLVAPTTDAEKATFFSTLAEAFAVTANLAPVAFTIDTDSLTISGALILDLGRTVEMGQVLTLTYTKPISPTVRIKDESGNETPTFTHSTADTDSKIGNDSTQDTAPWLASATVNAAGTQIDLIFDQDFVVPTGTGQPATFYTALASRFGLTVGGSAVTVSVNTTETSPTDSKLVLTPNSTIDRDLAVVVTYTDLTTGDDENVMEDATGASGNETATFTTGMGGVSAVKNNSTQGTDTTPPTLVSATVNAVGDEITLSFSEDLSSSGTDLAWGGVVRGQMSVTADGSERALRRADRQASPNQDKILFKVFPQIRQNQSVVVTYNDPTTGNDLLAIEDVAGNDAASFTTGSSSVPAVANGSTFVDTSPPTVVRAFVATDGTKLQVYFDDLLVVPADAAQKATFFSTLAGAFAVTANLAPVPFTIETNSVTRSGELILNLGRPIGMGQTVKLTYTKPTSGTVLIKDESDNETATFTHSTTDADPKIANGSEVDSAPSVVLASVPSGGTFVTLDFNEALAAPSPGDRAAFLTALASRFAVTADGATVALTVHTNSRFDLARVELSLNSAITRGQTIVVTYTDLTANDDANNVLQDAAGNDVATFTTGMDAVPAVLNNSTQGADTTAPTLVSATVPASGNGVTLVFSEDLAVTATRAIEVSPGDYFSVTVDGEERHISQFTHNSASAERLLLSIFGKTEQNQTVVVSYDDPTTGNDQHAVEDAAGNDAADFTTGQSGAPAVLNSSTFVDTSPPALSSATVVTDGLKLVMAFDDYLDFPTTDAVKATFFSTLAGTFAVTANSVPVAFTIDTDSNTRNGELNLDLTRPIEVGRAVTVTYTKPTSGTVLIKDESDRATATFTHSTEDADPKVFNFSTQDTAPWLASATVSGAGTSIELIFEQNFAVPTGAGQPAAFYTALAARLSLTVAGSAASFSIDAAASDGSMSKLVLTPVATITNGQAVVITYTDPAGDNDNVIQDATGNETATFTTGQGDVPAVDNNSTQGADVTAPMLTSATVNTDGSQITLQFDEGYVGPSSDREAFFDTVVNNRFTVTAGGASLTLYRQEETPLGSAAEFGMFVAPAVKRGETVIVTYTDPSGNDLTNVLQDGAGNDVASFTTGQSGVPAVVNNSDAIWSAVLTPGSSGGVSGYRNESGSRLGSITDDTFEHGFVERTVTQLARSNSCLRLAVDPDFRAKEIAELALHQRLNTLIGITDNTVIPLSSAVQTARTDLPTRLDQCSPVFTGGFPAGQTLSLALIHTDALPPQLISAELAADGETLTLQFDEPFEVPTGVGQPRMFYDELTSRLSMSIGTIARTFSIDASASDPSAGKLAITLDSTVSRGAALVLTYTDPTANDDENVIEDAGGRETATFTTGMGDVPVVTNNSTVAPTPPTLHSATVNTAGNSIDLIFSVPFAVPTGTGEPAAFYTALTGHLGLTVGGTTATFTIDTTNSDPSAGKLTLTPMSTVAQGATVVITYTDPSAMDDRNVIEDASGIDASTFTTGQAGVPAVANNSEIDLTPPTLRRATINEDGDEIEFVFTEAMAAPPASGTAEYTALVGAFTIAVDGNDRSITALTRSATDNSRLVVTVSPVIGEDKDASVVYTRGTLGTGTALADLAGNFAGDINTTATMDPCADLIWCGTVTLEHVDTDPASGRRHLRLAGLDASSTDVFTRNSEDYRFTGIHLKHGPSGSGAAAPPFRIPERGSLLISLQDKGATAAGDAPNANTWRMPNMEYLQWTLVVETVKNGVKTEISLPFDEAHFSGGNSWRWFGKDLHNLVTGWTAGQEYDLAITSGSTATALGPPLYLRRAGERNDGAVGRKFAAVQWIRPQMRDDTTPTGVSYKIQRKLTSGDWAVPADVTEVIYTPTTDRESLSRTIDGLTANTAYHFRVIAVKDNVDSEPSNVLWVRTSSELNTAQSLAANNPPTGGPGIIGSAATGETLTADTSGIEDLDGLSNPGFTYQWIRHDFLNNIDTDIADETASTYTVTAEDSALKVRVTFTDDAGNQETMTSYPLLAAPPLISQEQVAENTPPTGEPYVTGTAQVGQTLIVDIFDIEDADGLTNASFAYQWIRHDLATTTDTDIAGETGETYEVTTADEGKAIKVKVSFTDDAGNDESVTSEATAAVIAAPGLSLSDLDVGTGHEVLASALVRAGDRGRKNDGTKDRAWYATDNPGWHASGELRDGSLAWNEMTLTRVVYFADTGVLRFNEADADVHMGESFAEGGVNRELTIWVKTDTGTVSFLAKDNIANSGSGYINFTVPEAARSTLAAVAEDDLIIVAVSEPS